MSTDISQHLQSQILQAYENKTPLTIQAGNSKSFYGRSIEATKLDASNHQGIISYEPTELVITARAGTPLAEIESALDQHQQILPFDPPCFSQANTTSNATIGGTIACNMSGPRRAYTGAARDFVLGCQIINGKAEALTFGGQVMKNVAGYDASRLMCGAMGTLGLILDISIKTLPKPETEITLIQHCDINQALDKLHRWARQSLPISGSCFIDNQLTIRISGNASSVNAAKKNIGGETIIDDTIFWQSIKNQHHHFFTHGKPLWRLSLASNTPPLSDLKGETLYEWGGALRWLMTDEPAEKISETLNALGGHATFFKNNTSKIEPFHSLNNGLLSIHKQLKTAFDPENILNPGRMYSAF